MPIYTYKCPKCETIIDVTKYNIAEGQVKEIWCDTCRCRMEKQVALSHFQLKGTGWVGKIKKT